RINPESEIARRGALLPSLLADHVEHLALPVADHPLDPLGEVWARLGQRGVLLDQRGATRGTLPAARSGAGGDLRVRGDQGRGAGLQGLAERLGGDALAGEE